MRIQRLLLLFLSVLFIVISGCASKKYARQGIKFEKAGLWEMASQAYLQSLTRKNNNVDAIMGLKRAGQRALDESSNKIVQAYQTDNLKETVYAYLKADSLRTQASKFGVELTMSELAATCFRDAKPKYLEKLYAEAQALLDEEKFIPAEVKLLEVITLQPDFGNAQQLYKISKCEPLYRQARQYMTDGLYRKAYSNLNIIISKFKSYKDAAELLDEALQNAMITIKVNDFNAFPPYEVKIAMLVQNAIVSKLNNLNNPFIKLIDEKSTHQIINEQHKSEQTGGNLEIGKLLSAKAILNGDLRVIEINEGKTIRTEKRGFIKEETKTKDPKTGEEKVKVSYRKTVYYIYEQKNKVTLSFTFKLISTETGAVMVTDSYISSNSDKVEYAVCDGNPNKLVPGYWEKKDSDSPNDVINDDPKSIDYLRRLLNARQQIKSVNTLIQKAIDDFSQQTVMKINQYNPEN